jgi:hypothetical protein
MFVGVLVHSPFCLKAKNELDARNIPYKALELNVIENGMAMRAQLAEVRSAPVMHGIQNNTSIINNHTSTIKNEHKTSIKTSIIYEHNTSTIKNNTSIIKNTTSIKNITSTRNKIILIVIVSSAYFGPGGGS